MTPVPETPEADKPSAESRPSAAWMYGYQPAGYFRYNPEMQTNASIAQRAMPLRNADLADAQGAKNQRPATELIFQAP